MVCLDLNGNETPAEGSAAAKYCKSGSPNNGRILHGDVGIKARPGGASNMARQYSVAFLPRALALNMGNKGDLRSVRRQKQEGLVVRGNLSNTVCMENKMMEDKQVEDKRASKSL